MKTFGYGRVSTGQQTADNQRLELGKAGYRFEDDYWFADEGATLHQNRWSAHEQ